MTTIFDAIDQNDLGSVWTLVHQKQGLRDVDDETGLTPLALAAEMGHTEIVRILLQEGEVDPNHGGATTPLEAAVLEGDPEIVELLLRFEADVNRPVDEGFTPLMTAAMTGDRRIARMLLEAGARPRARNEEGKTAIDLAGLEGYDDLARELRSFSRKRFEAERAERAERVAREEQERAERRRTRATERAESAREALVTAQGEAMKDAANEAAKDAGGARDNGGGDTATMARSAGEANAAGEATATNSANSTNSTNSTNAAIAAIAATEISELPPEAPADLDRLEGIERFAALLEHDAFDTARDLVADEGVELEARDAAGRTPLMLAAAAGALEVVDILLDRGAVVDAVEDADTAETALVKAINHPSTARTDIIRRLAEHGAFLDRQHGRRGMTPLMYAATADVYLDDTRGGTRDDPRDSLDFAPMTRLLIELGADIETEDRHGNTVWRLIKRNAFAALTSSPSRRHLFQMLRVLERHGAEQNAGRIL